MNFDLIATEEFDNLPEDDEQCFVEFEAICRRNMLEMISADTSVNFDRAVQAQYMATVSSVAETCGLSNLAYPQAFESDHDFHEKFARFSLAVQGEVARIRIRGRRSRGSLSVQLTDTTQSKIRHYVSRLRELIDTSDLPADRKKALAGKLDELVDELEKRRFSLGRAMLILSFVVANLSGATTIAAEGQAAITHIMQFVGVDKESEERALSRLAPTPKALPAPATSKPPRVNVSPSWDLPREASDLDDDIPF